MCFRTVPATAEEAKAAGFTQGQIDEYIQQQIDSQIKPADAAPDTQEKKKDETAQRLETASDGQMNNCVNRQASPPPSPPPLLCHGVVLLDIANDTFERFILLLALTLICDPKPRVLIFCNDALHADSHRTSLNANTFIYII